MIEELGLIIATSVILFFIGIYGLVTKKDGLKMIFSIEILVCAANLALVGITHFQYPDNLTNQSFALLSLGVGGAMVGIALALLTLIYRVSGSIDLNQFSTLRW